MAQNQHQQRNYYTNPAFCQKSEFYNNQRALSPDVHQKNIRYDPVGAQATTHILDTSTRSNVSKEHLEEDYEQEFYEEMYVDDSGIVKQKNVLVVSSPNQKKFASPNANNLKHRYEYIPMQEQDVKQQVQPVRYHRYAVIPSEEEAQIKQASGRYALVPVEEVSACQNRYAVITDDYINHRYEYIADPPNTKLNSPVRKIQPNPIATQKLHELLTTPKKTVSRLQRSYNGVTSPVCPRKPLVNASSSQFVIHQSSNTVAQARVSREVHVSPPRAQQKLNYSLGAKVVDKRNTAIVAPVCSSPIQQPMAYGSEMTTYSPHKPHASRNQNISTASSGSWTNLSASRPRPAAAIQTTLGVASCMMILCGAVTCALCFYMISVLGRMYYLDFGTVAGFCCLLLGLMGCRGRGEIDFLPNRHYISGYIILSVFSLGTCACLLVLLFVQPPPGAPLADLTSGAVCGVSALSLGVAGVGVVSSYCCRYPPPDNRVEHCARGFTV